jgi:hypothetical protein
VKQKRPERVERRRTLVEINLIGERVKRGKEGVPKRGCMPWAILVVALGSGASLAVGLHLA